MANISDDLAAIFGTSTKTAAAQPTVEDLEKQAQIDFFSSLCVEKGIDIEKLEETQLADLFKTAMEMRKTASSGDDDKEKKAKEEEAKKKEADAKLASANAEYAEKRAAAQKVAEADAMGRIMAHSYVDELKKIAGEMPPQFMQGKKNDGDADDKGKDGKDKEKKEEDAKKEASAKAAKLIQEFTSKTAGAPAPTPSLDELAGNHAIDMLKQAGVDGAMAIARINAVHTLGVAESTKIASQTSTEAAIHVRALEYCEAAGFAVDWTT